MASCYHEERGVAIQPLAPGSEDDIFEIGVQCDVPEQQSSLWQASASALPCFERIERGDINDDGVFGRCVAHFRVDRGQVPFVIARAMGLPFFQQLVCPYTLDVRLVRSIHDTRRQMVSGTFRPDIRVVRGAQPPFHTYEGLRAPLAASEWVSVFGAAIVPREVCFVPLRRARTLAVGTRINVVCIVKSIAFPSESVPFWDLEVLSGRCAAPCRLRVRGWRRAARRGFGRLPHRAQRLGG
ncbi:uncharacterized protein SRS1_15899 [Sporisorium reilianum f. sp. reilianum]|uniref:Uncharacterized protein n=1 Tax=Sporisorium reilianum f. sp. reilianum TaxID=72559 RepID=A0A2N8UKS1_9BASI|nr:uncharacterized protein SRS1_15899 [Sporisorium reilianum f. sp. reilianum]